MLTKSDLGEIRKVINSSLDVKLEPIKKDTRKIRKDLKIATNFLDKEILKTTKRVGIIEEHLGLPEPDFI